MQNMKTVAKGVLCCFLIVIKTKEMPFITSKLKNNLLFNS